jgi:hypothetical protein
MKEIMRECGERAAGRSETHFVIFEQSGRQSEALLARSYCWGTRTAPGGPDDVSARKTGPGHARSLGSCRRDRACERSRPEAAKRAPVSTIINVYVIT